MTEERSKIDTDGVADPLVSRTYRESAAESTPAALDQAVLRRARREAGSRYSRSVLWLRPMAWAATIGLCLAIVVELSDLPEPDQSLMSIPASPADAIGLKGELNELVETEAPEEARSDKANTDDRAKTDETVRFEPEILEQRARKTIDEEGRVNLQAVPQLNKTSPEQAQKRQADNLPAAAIAPSRAAVADLAYEQQYADTDSLRLVDSPILEEADEMARMHEGKNKESELGALSSSVGLAAAMSTENPCDDEAKETPESWLECIESFEDSGLEDLADEQREQLQEAFPDFPLP